LEQTNTTQVDMSANLAKKEQNNTPKRQLIVFKLATQEYALFINQVKEVVVTPTITPVPLTPNYIKGVANIRGDILAMVDLETRFDLQATQEQEKPSLSKSNFTLVIAGDEVKIGLLVKDLPSTQTVYESDLMQPNLVYEQEGEKNYILNIAKLQERLIIVIDLNKIILKEDINATIENP
jgi:purine-binding chemotaxis protein CheW